MTEATRVYAKLKQDVATGVLAPGTSLSEADICKRYQAGRTPVREARGMRGKRVNARRSMFRTR